MDKYSVPYKKRKCFSIVELEMNFEDALKTCQKLSPEHDTNLASIEDAGEQIFLVNYISKIKTFSNDQFWIGSYGFKVDNEWVYNWLGKHGGNDQFNFTHWKQNSNKSDEDFDQTDNSEFRCIQMSMLNDEDDFELGRWEKVSCLKKTAFICQSLQEISPEKIKSDFNSNFEKLALLQNQLGNLMVKYEEIYREHSHLKSISSDVEIGERRIALLEAKLKDSEQKIVTLTENPGSAYIIISNGNSIKLLNNLPD